MRVGDEVSLVFESTTNEGYEPYTVMGTGVMDSDNYRSKIFISRGDSCLWVKTEEVRKYSRKPKPKVLELGNIIPELEENFNGN